MTYFSDSGDHVLDEGAESLDRAGLGLCAEPNADSNVRSLSLGSGLFTFFKLASNMSKVLTNFALRPCNSDFSSSDGRSDYSKHNRLS